MSEPVPPPPPPRPPVMRGNAPSGAGSPWLTGEDIPQPGPPPPEPWPPEPPRPDPPKPKPEPPVTPSRRAGDADA